MKCRNCKKGFKRKHPKQVFCSNQRNPKPNGKNCKDQYHNRIRLEMSNAPENYDPGDNEYWDHSDNFTEG